METFETIAKRASVREYQRHKPIHKHILEKIVDAGRRAPTARGVEPWEFVVITDGGKLKELSDLIPNGRFMLAATACIVVICQDTRYYLEDGSAATENILLAASDLGLGACWIAGDKKDYAPEVLQRLQAPEGYKLISLISVGWPKEEVSQNKKRSLSEVLHWEKF